jgi:hypothetical protein
MLSGVKTFLVLEERVGGKITDLGKHQAECPFKIIK